MTQRRRAPHWLIPAIGYTISVGCLIWVYWNFDWKTEIPKLLKTNLWWVALAVGADVCVYVIQGWRWALVLRPLDEVPLWRSVQAVYIGLFANEVLPLRSGEVIRAYLMARWTKLPFAVVVSSALTERLLDGVWLVLGFYAVTQFMTLPVYLETAGQFLALVVIALSVLLGLAVAHKSHAKEAIRGSRWSRELHAVVDAVHDIGRSKTFLLAALASLLYLALQVIPIYALSRGFGVSLSLGASAVLLVVLRFGTILPGLPSNLGTFQAAAILGLGLNGVRGPDATGFATLLFVVVTVPLWLAGFIALLATKMRLQEIHRDAHESLANGRRTSGAQASD